MIDRPAPAYPSLYQVNTRVWLTELSSHLGRPATLDDVPDADLDAWAAAGFDWIWLLSVWRTSEASRAVSRSIPALRRTLEETLPDLEEADIGGSGFAIAGYSVATALGGDDALARLRERLRGRGLRLMLDFVPNHMGLDHPWVDEHPEFFVAGTEADLAAAPGNFTRLVRSHGDRIFAHGRDPYFPGWTDTLQLDYANRGTQQAMLQALISIAARCDGVRCDMAMLILPDVFERTWGRRPVPFWPAATARVHEAWPAFRFMAEVYWDLEWNLLQQGFDYAYDKRLYDRLRAGAAGPVRGHLMADLAYQRHLARFLENHDEPRAAATFPPGMYEAAAVITFLTPGLRFLQDGQFEGRRVHVSPHLVRAPVEPIDTDLRAFYDRLLGVLRRPAVRNGEWSLLECRPAWSGDSSSDGFIAWSWQGEGGERLLVAVNYAPTPGRCFVGLGGGWFGSETFRLADLLGDAVYDRDGPDLAQRGLYLDVPPWQAHVFTITALR